MPTSEPCTFCYKKHSISMSDVPRIRKKSLKVSHYSATPEAFWIKHAFATSSVCKAKKKRRAFSKFLVVLCFLFLNITPLVSTHILAVSTQNRHVSVSAFFRQICFAVMLMRSQRGLKKTKHPRDKHLTAVRGMTGPKKAPFFLFQPNEGQSHNPFTDRWRLDGFRKL